MIPPPSDSATTLTRRTRPISDSAPPDQSCSRVAGRRNHTCPECQSNTCSRWRGGRASSSLSPCAPPPPPESPFFGWTCLKNPCGGGAASNTERGGDSGVANERRDGGERREGDRTTSYPSSIANRDQMDTQDTYNSSSQRLCYNSDPGELNLISVRSVVSASASVAGKSAAAASSREYNRRAVAVRSRGGSPSRSLMEGRGNDDNDDEAAVPFPPHVTAI